MNNGEQFTKAYRYAKLLVGFSNRRVLNGFSSLDPATRKEIVRAALVNALDQGNFTALDNNDSAARTFHSSKVVELPKNISGP